MKSSEKIDQDFLDTDPVWPGPATCPSHVSDTWTRVSSSVGTWTYQEIRSNLEIKVHSPGMLSINEDKIEKDSARLSTRLSEADVLATIETKSGSVKKMFNSLIERKIEAETFEKEAREKNLSVAEVEEKRIRGNRRKSRRSRDIRGEDSRVVFSVDTCSGLTWASKYQPRCGADILGNNDQITKLREWLNNWSGNKAFSVSTSEVSSEDIATDSEYELDVSVLEKLGNTCLLEGPTGSGKTAAVFALAAEMGFNVLEVNASSNRTGKQVLSMLSEATQSQQVRRDSDSKSAIFGTKGTKKMEETNVKKKMKTALILFEDIDLVF